MKTIEERINQIVEGHAECRWLDACDLRKYLEEVATEQKEIDIEKACEWLENWAKATEWYTIGESIEMLRKAMEE